ncbi:MAG: hypothetical protein WCH11_03110 [Bdellovibrio sp.]
MFFLSMAPSSKAFDELGISFFKDISSRFPSGQRALNELERSLVRKQNRNAHLVRKDGKEFWKERQDLLFFEDLESKSLERARTLFTSELRHAPSEEARVLLNIPPSSDVWILRFGKNFALVRFGEPSGIEGWVSLQKLALRSDFAAFAQDPEGVWKPVQHREFGELVLEDRSRLPLFLSQNFVPRKSFALLSRSHTHFAPGSRVEVLQYSEEAWQISRLPGHGEVYWKYPRRKPRLGFSTEQILAREIYSVSFHPQQAKMGLVAADGIFSTRDGESWHRLDLFQNQNLPVLVNSQGHLFVGHQWSLDGGSSFEPYLKLENLVSLLRPQASTLRLIAIGETSDRSLHVQIQAGSERMDLRIDPASQVFRILPKSSTQKLSR